MIFNDRFDAGNKIADKLKNYFNDPQCVVVAIPRGGVEVAFAVCQKLGLPMEIAIARKIGAPFSSELAVGAVNQDGDVVLNNSVIETYNVSQQYIDCKAQEEKEEIQRRLKKYRNKPPVDFKDKKVIIVDDGIATGATIRAIIKFFRKRKIQELIVAVPVACPEAIEEIKEDCDKIVCLLAPSFFRAVGYFYHDFQQTTDERVRELISRNENFN